jgi:hypothetical protein
MKKRVFTSAFLSIFVFNSLWANQSDTSSNKDKSLEIDLVYNHYLQNGNHSAVTGGKGTERLSVYAPSINLKFDQSKRYLNFNFGTDIITSASTDNIDFVKSSASLIDARTHANVGFGFKKNEKSIGMGFGFSIESDYFSRQVSFNFKNAPNKKRMSWGVQANANLDDLRWGRLNPKYKSPQYLIYPSELRNIQWFNNFKRNTFELKSKFEFKINSRNALGFFPELTHQNGLLSTPFHRVYFNDGSIKVENLPNNRSKLNLGFKWNTFLKTGQILKSEIDFFKDNFGVNAISAELTCVLPLGKDFEISPFSRYHIQSTSMYFKPFAEHNVDEMYYCSDYDLSAIHSIKIGFNLKILKFLSLKTSNNRSKVIKSLSISSFRYAYFLRNDGLNAHLFGIVISYTSN